MLFFPWVFLVLVLTLVAELMAVLPGAVRSLLVEHRVYLHRPTARTVALLTLVELLIVLIWGLLLRPR